MTPLDTLYNQYEVDSSSDKLYDEIKSFNTLVDVIKKRSTENKKGITFINETGDVLVSYKKLFNDCLKILKALQDMGLKPDDKIVFQITDTKDFILMFWACIMGGFVPVPLDVRNNFDHQMKFFKIWDILDNQYLATSVSVFNKITKFALENELGGSIEKIKSRKIITSELVLKNKNTGNGQIYEPSENTTALIQFSSGTTGDPKGVILTHENLLTNIKSILEASKISMDDSSLSWLPISHDMGLIGFHLAPMTMGIFHYIIPTIMFLLNPSIWMEKASEYRASVLTSPNFGYKHFLAFFNPEAEKNLDLSCVRLIYNGAEPISSDVCNKFLDKTEKFGLKRNSIFPVYGLAEATLAVTFPPPEESICSVTLNRYELGIGKQVVDVKQSDYKGVNFVDVGYPLQGISVRIVDNENNTLPENSIGIILVSGKNVTSGYYNNIQESAMAISADGWLVTGDLGFMRNNRLIVTGRIKDIIFVNGQNYYSHDLERIAEKVDGIEFGRIAAVGAFSKESHEDEIIIFVEDKENSLERFSLLAFELQKILYNLTGLKINHVIPISRIPRTTSGKIQRYKLRENYLYGHYDEIKFRLAEFKLGKLRDYCLDEKKLEIFASKIKDYVIQDLIRELKIPVSSINEEADLINLGVDSLTLSKILIKLEGDTGITLSPVYLLEFQSISHLARQLARDFYFKFEKYFSMGATC